MWKVEAHCYKDLCQHFFEVSEEKFEYFQTRHPIPGCNSNRAHSCHKYAVLLLPASTITYDSNKEKRIRAEYIRALILSIYYPQNNCPETRNKLSAKAVVQIPAIDFLKNKGPIKNSE
jgi:hypothetical protein